MWKSVLAIWGSTAVTIGIALYYTHDIWCLWFLIIPSLMSFQTDSNKKKDKEEVSMGVTNEDNN